MIIGAFPSANEVIEIYVFSKIFEKCSFPCFRTYQKKIRQSALCNLWLIIQLVSNLLVMKKSVTLQDIIFRLSNSAFPETNCVGVCGSREDRSQIVDSQFFLDRFEMFFGAQCEL